MKKRQRKKSAKKIEDSVLTRLAGEKYTGPKITRREAEKSARRSKS